jgi:tetratricopeptide (TPR) repeat protein/tRNA A-37 threonylcarbamoyl transferase component Bud32
MATKGSGEGVRGDGAAEIALDSTTAAPDSEADGSLDGTVAASTDGSLDGTVAAPSDASTSPRPEPAFDKTVAAPEDGAASAPATLVDQKRPERGQELGRYFVLELLGAGGMGEVYAAYDPELDRRVALKVIHQAPSMDSQEAKARLVAEAQALARLSHPNVVAVYDVGTLDDDLYIAMEYVDGRTLGQWIKEDEPGLEEVLGALNDAGRGLMAAHEAGLIHRDFKPDNVLISKNGRVRVIDFGVAFHAQQKEPPVEIALKKSVPASTLSSSKGLVGTPAFMAPEQFVGGDVDARTDQFSFASTLYQSLTGCLPFDGDSILTLAENVREGAIREIPEDASVPDWLETALRKALTSNPEGRFESMAELLDALTPPVQKSRMPLLMAGAALSAVAVVLFLFIAGGGEADPCATASEDMERTWNNETRTLLRNRFSDGADAWRRSEAIFDRYAQQWSDARTATCRAAVVRKEQSPAVHQARVACLERKRHELEAAVAVLQGQDADVEGSVQMASGLSSLAACESASGDGRSPGASERQEKAVRDKLARVRMLRLAGRYEDAHRIAKEARADAKSMAWLSPQAEALVALGLLELSLGKPKVARETLFEGLRIATQARDHLQAAWAWTVLVAVEANGTREYEEALRWAKHGDVAIEVAGADLEVRAKLAHYRGNAFMRLRKYDQSLDQYREAKALFEKALGKEHMEVAKMHGAIGSSLRLSGLLDEGIAEIRKSLSMLESIVGTDHPMLTAPLNNLANGLRRSGRLKEAQPLYERAIAIKEKKLGADHPSLASPLLNLALIAQWEGDFEKVEKLWQRALDVRIKRLGENHKMVLTTLAWRAYYLSNKGDTQEALVEFNRLAPLRKAREGVGKSYGRTLGEQCELNRRIGKLQVAQKLCDDALNLVDGAAASSRIRILTFRAMVALDQRKSAEAVPYLEKADAIAAKEKNLHGSNLGMLAFVRARLAAAEDKAEVAAGLVAEAKKHFQDAGAGYKHFSDAVQSWSGR